MTAPAVRRLSPVVAELFAGYGGLGMGVAAALGGGRIAWVSEIDAGPCKVLAYRQPDAPNLGDVTRIDWRTAPRVDVLTGGFPCQDVSQAGKRKGMKDGTRSGLWAHFRHGIEELRPPLVVIENVRGLLTAHGEPSDDLDRARNTIAAYDHLERHLIDRHAYAVRQGRTDDARILATRRVRVVGRRRAAVARARRIERRLIRAVARVLGELADLGYVGGWVGLRAADVGAPHGRFRVFIVAADASRDPRWLIDRDRGAAADTGSEDRDLGTGLREGGPGPVGGRRPRDGAVEARAGAATRDVTTLPSAVTHLLPTPRSAAERTGRSAAVRRDSMSGPSLGQAVEIARGDLPREFTSWDELPPSWGTGKLLPTPVVNDMGEGKTVERWDEWTDDLKARHGNGNGHGPSLAIEAQRLLPRLLPTPTTMDAHASGRSSAQPAAITLTDATARVARPWGVYAAAIERWEAVNGPAPAPTEVGPKGGPRLSARFSEWMMGVPAGWITDVPGVTRTEALKMAGNGVVPQQAEEAVRWLLPHVVEAVTRARATRR